MEARELARDLCGDEAELPIKKNLAGFPSPPHTVNENRRHHQKDQNELGNPIKESRPLADFRFGLFIHAASPRLLDSGRVWRSVLGEIVD
jgi:hypothetical protein